MPKAQTIGYNPEVILPRRRNKYRLCAYVAECIAKLLTQRRVHVAGANSDVAVEMIRALNKPAGIWFDVKLIFRADQLDARLWRLNGIWPLAEQACARN
jgi:hypothetical protein